MKSVVVTGKTKDEAITNALVQLGCPSDRVNIEVVEESKGVFGLFGKSMTIKAKLRSPKSRKARLKSLRQKPLPNLCKK